MRAALKLAEAKATNGDSAAAIAILEEASRFSGNWNFFDATVQYVDVRNALAQVYRKAGFNGEAEAIDQDLRLLLGQAPSEHPIKKRLLGAASPVS